MIKSAIWKCVIVPDATLPKEEQKVELNLLRDLMKELKTFINFYLTQKKTDMFKKQKDQHQFSRAKL
jgi:hypothetical protein